jgi:hypothetical protein
MNAGSKTKALRLRTLLPAYQVRQVRKEVRRGGDQTVQMAMTTKKTRGRDL